MDLLVVHSERHGFDYEVRANFDEERRISRSSTTRLKNGVTLPTEYKYAQVTGKTDLSHAR